ncbi:MAG: hypothetical protein ACYCSJ_03335 [Acidimicrobiales bacterium]
MTSAGEPQGLSGEQQAGWEARRAHQDRTLAAMHKLEEALGSAAPRREMEWQESVIGALAVLDQTTAEEAENAERPDSLLSDIARRQPRLRTRVRGVRFQYRHLRQTLSALRQELEEGPGTELDYGDVRQRLGWVLSALRHQRARESDLIYDAYYDAFGAELGSEED